MSLSSAEKAGLFGAVLLGGGLVAAVLLVLVGGGDPRPAPPPKTTPSAAEARSASPAGAPTRPADPPAPSGGGGAAAAADPDLRRELTRLRESLAQRDARIADLEQRLTAAGIPLAAAPIDPLLATAEAVEDLRACGPLTDPRDVEAILARIAEIGPGAVEPLRRVLDQQVDGKLAADAAFLGGRFVASPTIRIALFDALRRIGGVEGQSALVSALRSTEDPLETVVLVAWLADLKSVPTVAEVRLDAARRYVRGTPADREAFLFAAFVEVLADQPPAEAVADLLALVENPARRAETAEPALRRIAELPPATAAPALARLAARPQGGRIAETAAELLVERSEPEAFAGLSEALATAPSATRRAVYRSLAEPVEERLRALDRTGAKDGLVALERIQGLTEDLGRRRELLDARTEAERDPDLQRDLTIARRNLDAAAKRAEAKVAELRDR